MLREAVKKQCPAVVVVAPVEGKTIPVVGVGKSIAYHFEVPLAGPLVIAVDHGVVLYAVKTVQFIQADIPGLSDTDGPQRRGVRNGPDNDIGAPALIAHQESRAIIRAIIIDEDAGKAHSRNTFAKIIDVREDTWKIRRTIPNAET